MFLPLVAPLQSIPVVMFSTSICHYLCCLHAFDDLAAPIRVPGPLAVGLSLADRLICHSMAHVAYGYVIQMEQDWIPLD